MKKILLKITRHKIIFFCLLLVSVYSHADYDCSNAYQWYASGPFDTQDVVRFNGHAYQARWWTEDERPDLYSQVFGVWRDLGACRPTVKVTCDFNNDGIMDSA